MVNAPQILWSNILNDALQKLAFYPNTQFLWFLRTFQSDNLDTMSNAPDGNGQVQYCTVTHPFHTLYGKKIQIVSLKRSWDEYKVFYHQDDGRLISIPACWTSSYGPDVFNVISKGRSVFRFKELLELTRLVDEFLLEDQ